MIFFLLPLLTFFAALELNPVYLKVVLRRAQTYEVTDKLEDALKDYERAFELDPGCYEARAACMVRTKALKLSL